MWCPDHQEERRAEITRKMTARKIVQAHEYEKLGRPSTRVCTNGEPGTHEPGAVLPIGKFYTRPGKIRSDGTRAVYTDSQCKACRIEQAAARSADTDRDTVNRYKRNSRRNRRQRMRADDGRGRRLLAAPLREWLVRFKQTTGQPAVEIAKRAGVDSRTLDRVLSGQNKHVTLETVDKVGTAWSEGLVSRLYPEH